MSNNQKGFTLTEILVVVTIIVIIGVAILVAMNPMAQIFKGYDARRKADLSEIKIAFENYYADHECYPPFPTKIDEYNRNRPYYECGSDILKPYLDSMPCDPNTKKPYSFYFTAGATCPQGFAVYAEIYSFFGTQITPLEYCPDSFYVFSPGMTNSALNAGCYIEGFCPSGIFYGCKSSGCIPISGLFEPPPINCNRSYCASNCYDRCPTEEDSCPE